MNFEEPLGKVNRYVRKFHLQDSPDTPNERWQDRTQKILSEYRFQRSKKILVILLAILLVPIILIFFPLIFVVLAGVGGYKNNDLIQLCEKVKLMKTGDWLQQFINAIKNREVKVIGAEVVAAGVVSLSTAQEYNEIQANFDKINRKSYRTDYQGRLENMERDWINFRESRLIPDLPTPELS
jgi:hypothetical protein